MTLSSLLCTSQVLPRLPERNFDDVAPQGTTYVDKFWPTGSKLRVSFIDPVHPLIQIATIGIARGWSKYANISFNLADHSGDIRIGTGRPGNYSYVGTDARKIAINQPTMNLSVLASDRYDIAGYQSTILHEFGHALGLAHEQKHPEANIPWDRAKVFEEYRKHGWDDSKIELAFFKTSDVVEYAPYDPNSIMHYPVQQHLTKGNFELPRTVRLSKMDCEMIARIYPKN
ncbi:M12 family metallopeptidase [Loktanella sp. 3ANDIMAR09]|uniref:M12 family metallopeptidase n=1 Tax=Loktanella sp. 3ANDIMAR09 TaxID=1225657 RepID=UPI0007012B9A|nr:M12 family metallopeptidase [Loktanella sp. 3ANDIMAR09]